ncbi:MAG: elongation factor Ts [Patescibacteria group bacterium]
MTNNSAMDKVKSLREETGLSLAAIKKALDEAGGDRAKAREALKSLGASMAANKASRQVKEGVVEAYIHTNRKVGALAELLCETDFVARNEEFRALAHDIAVHIAAMKPADADELLAQPYVKDPAITVQELIQRSIGKLGENIQVGKLVVFEL